MAGQADFKSAMKATYGQIAHAATAAIREASDLAKKESRANIAAAGFSGRWQNALRANVYPKTGESVDAAAFIYHKIPYAGVFEHGATIQGKLWLPIEANLPVQAHGKRWTPQDFINNIGPLRPGKAGTHSVLFGEVMVGKTGSVLTVSKSRHAKRATTKWLPVFVAVSTVTDPKKFDIGAVVRDVAGELQELFAKNWK
jgi:hypothetical protein